MAKRTAPLVRGWSLAHKNIGPLFPIEVNERASCAVLVAGCFTSCHRCPKPRSREISARSIRTNFLWEVSYPEGVAERREERWWSAELHRLRGVFLTAMGAYEVEIEASFCEALRIAKEQKAVSLAKRAEATYEKYRRQKAIA